MVAGNGGPPFARRVTVAEVRRSYSESKRWEEWSGELPALLIFRPISFWVTPWFVRLGVSPVAVSLWSGVASLVMVAAASSGGPWAYAVVAAAGFVYQVLDCVDGNVARVTGRTSALGELLEVLIGQAYWALLFLSLGLLVEHAGGGVFGDRAVAISLGLAITVLLHRVTRNHVEHRFGKSFVEETPSRAPSPGQWLLATLAGLENLYVFAIAIGGWLGALDRVLAAIAIYVVGVFGFVVWELVRDLSRR